MAPHEVVMKTIRRPSRGCWADFIQRVRLGLIGAVFILIIMGLASWI